MMNIIYKEAIEKHAARGTIIRIYMDDIAIATTGTLQDHIDAVRDILRVAEQNDLYFKLSKCTFHTSSIDYLVLRLVGRSVRRARDGVILKSTTNRGGLP
jgi:hypothetical protein